MQKKTLLTLIQVVPNIILCFVATFGYCLAITCRFVHEIVTWLYLACSKKHVQQESVSQLQDYYNKSIELGEPSIDFCFAKLSRG